MSALEMRPVTTNVMLRYPTQLTRPPHQNYASSACMGGALGRPAGRSGGCPGGHAGGRESRGADGGGASPSDQTYVRVLSSDSLQADTINVRSPGVVRSLPHGHGGAAPGGAVQVGSIKPRVESAYGRLKLEYDEPLSNFAFISNLRRYSLGPYVLLFVLAPPPGAAGRCRLTVSNPC